MTLLLKIDGPHIVPRTPLPGGLVITKNDIARFWDELGDLADECGCYVFGIRAGRGIMPGYVGKAARRFRQEVFTSHKLVKYQTYMARTRKGTPVLFFAVAQRARGRINETAISHCELELINLAWRTNPDLENERGLKGPSFVIPHVTEPVRGKPSAAAKSFCAMLDLLYFDARRVEVRADDPVPPVPSDIISVRI